MDIKVVNAKLEANALIVKAHIEFQKYLNQARNILLEAEISTDEISEFMKERNSCAKMLSEGYFSIFNKL